MGGRRQFGAVRRLPSGRYQARYVAPDGKRRHGPQTFKTKADAVAWLARIQTEIGAGSWLAPEHSLVSVTRYAQSWIADRRVKGRPLAPRTVETYTDSLDRWITPMFGAIPIGRVTPAMVRTWHAEVALRGGPTAARQSYALLHAIFRTAVDDDAVAKNPCRIPGAGQASSPERPYLTDEEVERLARAMPEHLYAFVLLASFAHLRLGELLGLERRDIDLDLRKLRVRRQVVEVDNKPIVVPPKASSARVINLPEPAAEALRAHLLKSPRALPKARVFVRRDGSELRQHHVHAAWKSARVWAGLPQAHIHDLRHAGLTAAAQEGASIAQLMLRAGHSTVRAAMIYQHAADDRDVDVAERLSRRAARRDVP